MKHAIQKPSDQLKRAHKRVWQLVVKYRLPVLGATGVVAILVAVATVAYFRTRQKAVWVGNVTVVKSQTYPVTDDLSITLTDLKERPDQSGFVVMATVIHTDLPEMEIRNASVGYIVTYPKEHGYNIELIKADAASAKFSITKNP
jgi:hypothetical protein